jgi:hypothetical protein
MPVILKFWNKDGKVSLDKYRLEDITNDKRSAFIDRKSFYNKRYHVGNDVYFAINDFFFKMATMLDKNAKDICAMLLKDEKENKHIVIVPSTCYVFWNGKSVDPSTYSLTHTENDALQMLQTV